MAVTIFAHVGPHAGAQKGHVKNKIKCRCRGRLRRGHGRQRERLAGLTAHREGRSFCVEKSRVGYQGKLPLTPGVGAKSQRFSRRITGNQKRTAGKFNRFAQFALIRIKVLVAHFIGNSIVRNRLVKI